MLQYISVKFKRFSASLLLFVFYTNFLFSNAYASQGIGTNDFKHLKYSFKNNDTRLTTENKRKKSKEASSQNGITGMLKGVDHTSAKDPGFLLASTDIGGPSQPEMSSFKSAGTSNMVNLFTGDFSYNIPLMDVGGYPLNIYYDANIGMEQEASWVGLGWNINPGNVNRNMRGVPDDFNGEELLKQVQVMKPNKTWGVKLGADLELAGIKGLDAGVSYGVSVNNYLGPSLELGGSVGYTLSSVANIQGTEKSASIGVSANLSSRNGLTVSPYASLSGQATLNAGGGSIGLGLKASTSFNSRSGIKSLQLGEQMSFNKGSSRCGNTDAQENANRHNSTSGSLMSTSISFAKPSYIPTMRMKITNSATAGRFQLGGALYSIYGSAQLEGYGQVSEVADGDVETAKPMIGYLNYDKAKDNPDAVMDFTRFNDNEVMPSTPIISVPQYSYDVFSVQGEGTGGSIRAYRNDLGYVRDNLIESKDKSVAVGVDIGIPGHIGGNFSIVKTPTSIGEWNENNLLRSSPGFKANVGSLENVYFRNPGESSILSDEQFKQIGGADLVRYKLGGTQESPSIEPVLEQFSKLRTKTGETPILSTNAENARKKRTQVISFLTAREAKEVGLDREIKNYNSQDMLEPVIVNPGGGNQNYWKLRSEDIHRCDDNDNTNNRLAHHISQINITESNGKRYIYGIPVYNTDQWDFTFSVNNTGDADASKVQFGSDDVANNSPNLSSSSTNKMEGYLLKTQTPAYAHSFLLSGLLSSDYVDVKGDGITEDDLGSAIKFNYTKMLDKVKWRTPLTSGMEANFNPGKRTEKKDDKGIVSYGERESWYVHSIESKSMIALFTLESRDDGKGATNRFAGINETDESKKRLKKIDLYNKADLKKNGPGAKPVKTVWFDYDYRLCQGTPDHPGSGGKLTLSGIHFTYNGKRENSSIKDKYLFSYAKDDQTPDNPSYEFNGSDRWGTYKSNGNLMKNADFPYTVQDKTEAQRNASAWTLKKILLPSGGQMEINYESDDYAFVQNKRAAMMMNIVGFNDNPTNVNDPNDVYSKKLYKVTPFNIIENNYVFIQVPTVYTTIEEAFNKYLKGIDQFAFKLAVLTPKSHRTDDPAFEEPEYVNCYARIDDASSATPYGFYKNDPTRNIIWIKLKTVDGFSPLSLSAIEFLRQQLPGQAYKGYDVSESSGLKQQFNMLTGLLEGLVSASIDPINFLRQKGLAQEVIASKSFVRLNVPDGHKFGGGHRVKSIKLKDNWKAMNNQMLANSEYGQEYDYTTTENFNGMVREISSGVASYEPSLGGDENPFQTIWQYSSQAPFGPASYGAVEMPVLDAFFPSPVVGYSKVTVRSINTQQPEATNKKSGIGKQVSEFYTAKDFPVYYNNTPLDVESDRTAHASTGAVFYSYTFDSRAISQGFIVETNDMHGKLKSQASYSQNDDKTPINYTENFYKNTGVNGLDEKLDFIDGSAGGKITPGNMGIDIELMTDTRQFTQKTNSFEVQAQLDLFPVTILLFWLPFIWPVVGKGENTYRAVTTTKVINFHSVLDRVVVIDKGSEVSTENLVYDSETGEPVVTKTNNEFDQPVYNISYPAYWAYSGMGLAYKNIDAIYTANFIDGVISGVPTTAFESGDELYLIYPGDPSSDACAASYNNSSATKLWAFDTDKETISLTNPSPKFVFMDETGKLYSKDNVIFKIIRSGKRNMLDAKLASLVTMRDPILKTLNQAGETTNRALKIVFNDVNGDKVVNASAVSYKEKWQTDDETFKRHEMIHDYVLCTDTEGDLCEGYLDKQINPYVKGLIGNFKPNKNFVFYGERSESNQLQATNISKNGFLSDFKLYWDFDNDILVPDPVLSTSKKWVASNEVTRVNAKGLELETKDASEIYTAAQYGYNKSIPVAIANNAHYNEMFAEGFEDYFYDEGLDFKPLGNEGLNSKPFDCFRRHVDFLNFPSQSNGTIWNTDDLDIKAHTGKYVMSVDQTVLEKVFTINDKSYDFSMVLGTDGEKSPPVGGNTGVITSSNFSQLGEPDYFNGGASFSANVDNSPGPDHRFNIPFNYYINVSQKGTYSFHLFGDIGFQFAPNAVDYDYDIKISLSIYDVKTGRFVTELTTLPPPDPKTNNENVGKVELNPLVPLCPGIYYITGYFTEHYRTIDLGPAIRASTFSITNDVGSPCYQSLGQVEGCTFKTPIPATDLMLNPTLNFTPGQKMYFSGWVNENCSTTSSCANPNYTHSQVFIGFGEDFESAPLLIPSGPVIEGWQKVEGEFTIPEQATKVIIAFINDMQTPNYWDDIRIHPYNSNMKSYVYDPVNLRLTAQLDANNYATFYEYDDEGILIRTKAETKEGIKTLTETRSAKQKTIGEFQQ